MVEYLWSRSMTLSFTIYTAIYNIYVYFFRRFLTSKTIKFTIVEILCISRIFYWIMLFVIFSFRIVILALHSSSLLCVYVSEAELSSNNIPQKSYWLNIFIIIIIILFQRSWFLRSMTLKFTMCIYVSEAELS